MYQLRVSTSCINLLYQHLIARPDIIISLFRGPSHRIDPGQSNNPILDNSNDLLPNPTIGYFDHTSLTLRSHLVFVFHLDYTSTSPCSRLHPVHYHHEPHQPKMLCSRSMASWANRSACPAHSNLATPHRLPLSCSVTARTALRSTGHSASTRCTATRSR